MQLFSDFLLLSIVLFVCLLLVTALVHVWYRMPYVPTPMPLVRLMVDMAHLRSHDVVYDLGAGDGRLLIEALKKQPNLRAIGYEIAPAIWLLGWLRIRLSKFRPRFLFRNFLSVSLTDADVIFLYLLPEFMTLLSAKFDRELRSGTRVISHGFCFPHRQPTHVHTLSIPLWGEKKVYSYLW